VRSSVVLVTPIAPAATGNGLAMRAGMLLDALAPAYAIDLVVVPVAGHPDDETDWATERARSVTVVDPVTSEQSREHTTRLLADPELRARLGQTAPLPELAALVPPTLAPNAAAQLGDPDPPDTVLVMRSYLAPFGIQLARQLKAARIVVDADDDDAALLHAVGEHDKADAFERLARTWLCDADAVVAASPADAESLAARAGLRSVGVVPNSVQPPGQQPEAPGEDRMLFLGNLTYGPTRAAAQLLADEILPAVRQRRPAATLDLVGAHDGALDKLAAVAGVRVIGPVGDVAPCYATADVVVVPLRHGAGTRIKLLEAFAHRRPVIATPVAATGLDLDGDELVLAESVDEIADAVVRVLADPEGAAAMVDRAARVVERGYSAPAVARLVRAAVRGGPMAP
jgi:glycosyltransferase involved in cell wall biosynthesis